MKLWRVWIFSLLFPEFSGSESAAVTTFRVTSGFRKAGEGRGFFKDYHNLASDLIEDSRNFISFLEIQFIAYFEKLFISPIESHAADPLHRERQPNFGGAWSLSSVYVRPERLERDGPCGLMKLRQMGTQRVHIKGVLTWLVRWARRAGTIDFCPFFLTVHYFTLFVLITQQTIGRQSCRDSYLLICVSECDSVASFLCVHYI